ncbi:MAG: class I SAM-dependent methyltransferase [Planctomycetota bacterium]
MSGDERIEGEARERFLRGLQAEAADRGDPIGWFEPLYAKALEGQVDAPWEETAKPTPCCASGSKSAARRPRQTRPRSGLRPRPRRPPARRIGYRVDAVDLSASAIALARQHNSHPATRPDFAKPTCSNPRRSSNAFDLIVEIYTLQAIPKTSPAPHPRPPRCLAPGGELLVICRARDGQRRPKARRGPRRIRNTRPDADPEGLKLVQLERFHDGEDPRDRFRALLRAPN